MEARFDELLATRPAGSDEGDEIGRSREGRAVRGFRCGHGPTRISLIGGCHADEPVGPRLLRHLAAYLRQLPAGDPARERFEWWLVPHANPDGEARNRRWHSDDDAAYDPVRYLRDVVRELPGDDVEFGFPAAAEPPSAAGSAAPARPENEAIARWWRSGDAPFHLHASLHGMAIAAGPWFLIEPAWRDRVESLKARCRARTLALGYALHDVERHGEKGFWRLERGFCTRPDSRAMREHFLALGDSATAALFRPSSMETIRALGGDPLTLVSEMPLFIAPGVGESLGPPDPKLEAWRRRISEWRVQLETGGDAASVHADARAAGLRAMPVRDQMNLQWTFVAAGIEQVTAAIG